MRYSQKKNIKFAERQLITLRNAGEGEYTIPDSKNKAIAEMLLALSVIIWAGNYTVSKIGIQDFSPLTYTTLRFIIATPLIYLLLKIREGKLDFPRDDLPRVIVVGIAGITLYQTTFMLAIKYSSVTIAALGLGVAPIFTVLLGAALGQEKLRKIVLGGCLIAFIGLYMVIRFGPAESDVINHTPFGDSMALVAGFLWGLYPILATPLLKKRSGVWVASHSSLFGTIALAAITMTELSAVNWQAVSTTGWLALLYSAVPNTVIAMVALYYGIEKIGPIKRWFICTWCAPGR